MKHNSDKELEYRRKISELLSQYIVDGDVESFLQNVFNTIGGYLDIVGIYFFEFDMQKQTFDYRYGWSGNGDETKWNLLKNVAFRDYDWAINQMLCYQKVSISNLETIKDVAPAEYTTLKQADVSALFDVLVITNDEPHGFLCVEYKSTNSNVTLIEKEIEFVAEMLSKIIERSIMEDAIISLSERDQLTQAYNRQAFIQKLKCWKEQYTLFFVDIDRFKFINDTYGHEVGDVVIKSVVREMTKRVKGVSTVEVCVGRYGGDEFVLAIKSIDEELLDIINNELRNPIQIQSKEGLKFSVSLCIGYKKNSDGKHVKEIIQKADYAMYVGKKKGTTLNNVDFYDVREQYEMDYIIMKEFEEALARKEIYPVFQPKMNMKRQQVNACEMLCRWRDSKGREISPGMFIPSIEKSGKMYLLDFYMFEEACLFLARLKERGINHRCSVNISLKTLAMNDVVERLIGILEKYPIDATMITIEVLENIFETTNEDMHEKLEKLRGKGFLISIDDFGLEYSSLSRLYSIPFDEIKIPREFLINMNQDVSRKVFELILLLAQNVGVSTVIEGVEEKGQLEICLSKSVDYVQGFYYSKPLKEEEYLVYLSRHHYDVPVFSKKMKGLEVVSSGILNHLPQAVLLLDNDRRVVYSNQKLEQLLKLDEPHTIGKVFGNAFQCSVAVEERKGCGTMSACGTCSVKNLIQKTVTESQPQQSKVTKDFYSEERLQTKDLDIYATPYDSGIQNITMLTIEDIS